MGYLDKPGAVSLGRDSHLSPTRPTHDLVIESTPSQTLQASLLWQSVYAEVSAGQHLCLFKSKSNRLQWHLSHTVFAFTALSCGSNWCPWLFIRLLTFQAVSYDSVAPGSGVPGEDCGATDDSGKKEQRTCRGAGRGEKQTTGQVLFWQVGKQQCLLVKSKRCCLHKIYICCCETQDNWSAFCFLARKCSAGLKSPICRSQGGKLNVWAQDTNCLSLFVSKCLN